MVTLLGWGGGGELACVLVPSSAGPDKSDDSDQIRLESRLEKLFVAGVNTI